MKLGIFTIFSVFGIVSNWATKALEDGKVTGDEALDLVDKLCECIGVVPEFTIPVLTPTGEEVIEKTSNTSPDTSKETDAVSGDRAPPGEFSPEFLNQAEEGRPHTEKEVTNQ